MTTKVSLLLAVCLLSSSAFAEPAAITIAEYRQQLVALTEEIESFEQHPEQAGALEAGIPESVAVRTSSGEITVHNQRLKNDLAALSKTSGEKQAALLRQITTYVQELQSQAAGFEQPGADTPDTRQKLEEILARKEFRNIREPSLLEIIQARIYRWLGRLLSRVHAPRSSFNWIQNVIWGLIGAVIAVLAFWTIRRLMRPEEPLAFREIIPFSPSARSWSVWLKDARDSAAKQDWRNAIHLAYWAGISYLESSGAWKPSRSRTPREYLRLLTSRNPRYPILSALTRRFEIVWYGQTGAREADFQETLAQLEKLGCR
jgi:Domain of unknown function (DUF4129)